MTPYLRLLRAHQWLKNLMLLFPPFLSGALLQPALLQRGVLPILSFCLASSATYVFNDVHDAERDRHHPVKKGRPVACGEISRGRATFFGVCLLVGALFCGSRVPGGFFPFLAAYLLINACYTLGLKALPVVDIFCIAAGFVLRLQGGGAAFGVIISEWLFLSVFLLAVFLSTGKRLCEKGGLADNAANHRKSLEGYPEGFLELAMGITGAAVLVTYAMYTLSRHALIYTVPLCTFGLLRYTLRVKAGGGGDPTDALLKDLPLCVTGLLWVVLTAFGIYR
ncbi:decaprenyl-phosphate phosphoribosyltransferase [Geomonas sp. RF6]|uniref:decaprenyl-phosphate phosphoribosyltransferase n=1 Tax=Geomonas sp. RF6 TaxID=2897342 RepID=UPI001E44C18E|nr:decaprenyl-phosphate phosphoribosyltransferase [Geomonas sp. RF6]UFS69716.1 decaprenyl-phosphate phosphoribosyltransferase [Geomonas sp. RF6]